MSSAGQTLMFPETMSETAEINTSPVQDSQQPMMKVETHEPRELHDWYIASGHLHFAKDRSVFITYRTIEATAEGKNVIGIAAVKLMVQKAANKPDAANEPDTRVLTLGQVLHIPEMRFNGYASKPAEGVAPVRTKDGARSYVALGELKCKCRNPRSRISKTSIFCSPTELSFESNY